MKETTTMNRAFTLALPLAALALASCANPIFPDTNTYPPYEGAGYTDRPPTEKERRLAARDFSVEIASVRDDRRPRSSELDAPDAVIYEYEPNDLLQGVVYRVPVIMNKYLNTNAKNAKHYLVDVNVRNLKAQIVNGTFFSGGHVGRYRVEVEVDILARRAGSSLVVVNEPVRFELYQPRHSFNGRQPSAEMDRARVYDLMEDALRRTAERAAWRIRGVDARRWDPVSDQIKQDKAAANRAYQAEKAKAKAAANNTSTQEALPPRDEYITPNKLLENWQEPIQDNHPASWNQGS